MSTTTLRHYDTIVLGAGISGLACASRLYQRLGSHRRAGSLLVLEARDRLGGRIGAVHVRGHRLDTGANWIHGVGTEETPNPLMRILPHKRFKQISSSALFRIPKADDGGAGLVNDGEDDGERRVDVEGGSGRRPNVVSKSQQGDLIVPSKDAEPLVGALWGLIGSLHELATEAPADEAKNTPMLKAITNSEAFREVFEATPAELHGVVSALPQFVENMEAGPLVAQSAEHTQDHPGMALSEFALHDFDGDQVFLQDGYVAVVEELARELIAAGIVEMGVQVERILWDEKPIVVESDKGKFTADRIVCTLPLGVLKKKQEESSAKRLFHPSLPQAKEDAVSSLGFGTLDKIFLIYKDVWWKQEPYSAILRKGTVQRPFGGDEDNDSSAGTSSEGPDSWMGFTPALSGISIKQDGTTTPGPRTISLMNLDNLTGVPALSCFVSCSNAVHVESLSDSAAGLLVHDALTSWLGCEPPRPEAVHITRWAQDPLALGSYTHMITGVSETRHRLEFQRPVMGGVGGELRFAGEHTSLNHFATVHGALLSGWREADGILGEKSEGE